MPTLDLQFVPGDAPDDVAIVVDALRMTTTCTAMLTHGAAEIVVVADADEARAVAASAGALLFGERGGLPLEGFDGGNSPLQLDGALLRDRRVVVCTSNGSKAVEAASGAEYLLLGAAVNAPAVAARALELGRTAITVVCAGTDGRASLDDVLAGGCILRELLRLVPDASATDAALIALAVANAEVDLAAGLARSGHGRTLARLGFDDDLRFAGRLGSLRVVAERRAGEPPTFTAQG